MSRRFVANPPPGFPQLAPVFWFRSYRGSAGREQAAWASHNMEGRAMTATCNHDTRTRLTDDRGDARDHHHPAPYDRRLTFVHVASSALLANASSARIAAE